MRLGYGMGAMALGMSNAQCNCWMIVWSISFNTQVSHLPAGIIRSAGRQFTIYTLRVKDEPGVGAGAAGMGTGGRIGMRAE